jgi:FkbM family methyltransferase
MSWVSYAQNYEDVVLARVLADVREGFWIDVGAQDPRMDSVTCAFAERGWRGINIEPVAHWHARLAAARPADVNLCLAAGDHAGTMPFFEVDDSGLSTARGELAARHRARGLPVREVAVPVRTLASVCAEHVRGPVHFLKVDAEGAEAEVLRGMDFAAVRPWVVLVEATEPNSRRSSHDRWEPMLLAQGYAFAYDDGINRYYLAGEHAGLAPRFGPPTVFDDFVRREQVDAVAAVEARAADVDALSHRRAEELDALVARVAEKDAELAGWHARWQAEAEAAATLRGELGHAAAREAALRDAHAELAAREATGATELDRMHREAAVLQAALADAAAREAALLAGQAQQADEVAAQGAAALAEVRSQGAAVLADARAQGAALQSALEAAKEELLARQADCERLGAEASAARGEASAAQRALDAQRVELDATRRRDAAAREANDRLRREAEARQSALAAAGAREAALRDEVDELRAEVAALGEEAAALRAESAAVGEASAVLREEAASLRGDAETMRAEAAALQAEAAALEGTLAAAASAHEALRAALARSEARAAAAEQAVAKLSRQVPDLEAQVRAANAAHALAHAELLRHVGIIETLRAEHAVVQRSRSWRLTAPLRVGNALLARWRDRVSGRRGADAMASALAAAPELPLTEDAERILAHAPVFGARKD